MIEVEAKIEEWVGHSYKTFKIYTICLHCEHTASVDAEAANETFVQARARARARSALLPAARPAQLPPGKPALNFAL